MKIGYARLSTKDQAVDLQVDALKQAAYVAATLYRQGQLSARQIAEKLHISKSTLYAYLRHRGVAISTEREPAARPHGFP